MSAICTFSTTVIEPNVAATWNVRPTPSRQISRGFLPFNFDPSNQISPESAGSCPFIILKQVDLPAPLGPISARNSPCFTSKLTSLTARTPPKAFDNERMARSPMTWPHTRDEFRQTADDAAREGQHKQ